MAAVAAAILLGAGGLDDAAAGLAGAGPGRQAGWGAARLGAVAVPGRAQEAAVTDHALGECRQNVKGLVRARAVRAG